MAKTNGSAKTETQSAPPEELLALEVWADEVHLDPVRRQMMRVLYRGQKRTRADWQRALEEALNRPVR